MSKYSLALDTIIQGMNSRGTVVARVLTAHHLKYYGSETNFEDTELGEQAKVFQHVHDEMVKDILEFATENLVKPEDGGLIDAEIAKLIEFADKKITMFDWLFRNVFREFLINSKTTDVVSDSGKRLDSRMLESVVDGFFR